MACYSPLLVMQLIDYWSLLGAPGSIDGVVHSTGERRGIPHGFEVLNGIGTTVLSVATTFGWFL